MVPDGVIDGEALRAYAEHVLVPKLEEADILVMGNLSNHSDSEARQIIGQSGTLIWDLPPNPPVCQKRTQRQLLLLS